MATSATASSSGLDVAGIVSQLMAIEQRPLTSLARKEASYQAKLSAYGSIQGALSSFQSAVSGLSNASKFQSLASSSSDSSVVTVSATSAAVVGTYSLDITKLAQSQKLVALGKTSDTAAIGTGASTTLTFDFGTISGTLLGTGKYDVGATFTSSGSGAKAVTIDSSNNSLQGIRDAINNAKIGITATIVNDGGASPFRLALSSDNIGKTNSIQISVAGDTALSDLLAHDPASTQNLAETATAQNAELKVNGIAVSKTSNTISDVIQGVTLNLQKATSTTPISVIVARDTASVSSAVTGFVKAYNDLSKALQGASAYDPATKRGAILQGDSTVRALQTKMRAVLNTPISNTGGSLTTLSQIGVSFQKDGTLALDSTKLSNAISNNFSDIASLFAMVGKASDSLVAYSSATTTTKPGSYAVDVSTLATQGKTSGNFNLNVGLNTIASGTTINTTLDGVNASVALTAGSYTATQLAMMVQSAINGTAAFSLVGLSVAAAIDGSGFMSLTSNRYGSASNASILSEAGSPVTDFMGSSTDTLGVDVAGTIDGASATGSGQFLTADAGNVAGLKIQIKGGITGARGTVNYSQGYAYLLDKLSTSLLATDGPLSGRTKGINSSIADIGKQRDAMNVRLSATQTRLTKLYSGLDKMLASMNATNNYLSQQLANLSYDY